MSKATLVFLLLFIATAVFVGVDIASAHIRNEKLLNAFASSMLLWCLFYGVSA